MPWQEAISTLGNQTFHVLRVGHPQCKKKATSSMKYLSGLSLPYDFMADSRIFSS